MSQGHYRRYPNESQVPRKSLYRSSGNERCRSSEELYVKDKDSAKSPSKENALVAIIKSSHNTSESLLIDPLEQPESAIHQYSFNQMH